MTLKKLTFTAVRWTVAAAIVQTLLQLAQVAVLARLLAPKDFGAMAIIGSLLGLFSLLSDLGLNAAYVQKQEVTPEQRSSLFLLAIGVSTCISLILVASGPLAASFFSDDRLAGLLTISATGFLVSSLGSQLRLTAEKCLNFRPVVMLDIAAAAVGFCGATAAAIAGFGVYSLALGNLAAAIAGTTLAWRYLAHGWRPVARFEWREVRSFLGFSGPLVGSNVINQINLSIDLLIGGRMLTSSLLGLYSIPRNLVLQAQFTVNPIITRVGFPLIAMVQSDIPRVRSIYLRTLAMVASVNSPLYLGLAFFAPEIVWLLLGNQWNGSIELLRILAIWGFLRSTGNPVGSLLVGMGRADLALKWNIFVAILLPPVVWAGSWFGAEGMASALLAFSAATFVPGWYFLVRPLCHMGFSEYAAATFRPFGIALIAILPAYLVADRLDSELIRLAAAVGVAAPLYLAISTAMNREWVRAMLELAGKRN